jgi:hypothetical protein
VHAQVHTCPCTEHAVGYAEYTSIKHNQIDDVPYSGITIGLGRWLSQMKFGIDGGETYTNGTAPHLGPLSNCSHGNVIADSRWPDSGAADQEPRSPVDQLSIGDGISFDAEELR